MRTTEWSDVKDVRKRLLKGEPTHLSLSCRKANLVEETRLLVSPGHDVFSGKIRPLAPCFISSKYKRSIKQAAVMQDVAAGGLQARASGRYGE